MMQQNNSVVRRFGLRRIALLASVAGVGVAVLAGGPEPNAALNPSAWLSSAAAAEIHGWMGVRIQAVTADLADSLGLKKAEGALVAEPQSGSPAAKAGILAGDVITAVDGNEVKDPRDLTRKISAMAPGTEVKLSVQRQGEEKTLSLTLGQPPDEHQGNAGTDRQQASPFERFFRQFGLEDMPNGMRDRRFGQNRQFGIPQPQPRAAEIHGWMGVRIQAVTADIADSLGLKKAEGALVAEPQSGSPAAKAGILAGDVITAVDGNEVKEPRDLARKVSAMAPGTEVKLSIQRQGEEKTLSLTLGQPPDERQGNAGTERQLTPDSGTPRLGLTLAAAGDVGGAGNQGVAITSVDPVGPAAAHGIKTGDVILDVAGKPVSRPEDVRQQLAAVYKDGKRTVLIRVKSGDAIKYVAVALGRA